MWWLAKEASMSPWRVVLVTDRPILRHGLHLALAHPAFHIVGEARDSATALNLAGAHDPDLLLCDTTLMAWSGMEIGRVLRRVAPRCRIIIIAEREIDDDELLSAVSAGVAAVATIDLDHAALVNLAQRVGRGEWPINSTVLARPAVARRMVQRVQEWYQEYPPRCDALSPLTPREMEILDCVARGLSNKEIAESLSVSAHTIKNHVTNMLQKLALDDRTQAVVYAVKRGWIVFDTLEATR
jgi:DNA-binding NarL/FixJ family response regulator